MAEGISTARIAFASLIGTAIEFYDFYIYGMAAALVIGPVFFPHSTPLTQALNAFLTFGLAFFARPLGAALFGHFGDKIGRKATLVASLLVMGVSTVMIGLLPGYANLGMAAPILLCLLRFGQGLGLGGEWGGAALLATENAPQGKRGWFGMFPQLGPPLGFLCATLSYLALATLLNESQFLSWGWRIPFIASALLVAVGLYVRYELAETPVFTQVLQHQQQVGLPIVVLFRQHWLPLLLGALAMVVCYALFYIATVFALSYGTAQLHIPRQQFLGMLCVAVLFMAMATPLAARAGDIFGRRPVLMLASGSSVLFGFALAPMLGSGSILQITVFLSLALFLMGATFAPMGALLPELFPAQVRYTGSGMSYNLGGILGASFAPYIAQKLVAIGDMSWVGGYISVAAGISFVAVWMMRETHLDAL
ncbi:MAG: MHS family MFS transporter [Methylophilales bacterium]|nr:MHS family MFS transporter [Methylophilales bacterium]